MRSGDKARPVQDEVADILTYLLRFADLTGIDLDASLTAKATDDERRYTFAEAKGSAAKAAH